MGTILGIEIVGVVEATEETAVAGWAFDPSSAAPIELGLFVDGKEVARTLCDAPRADVLNRFGREHVGFKFQVPALYHDGLPHLCAIRTASGCTVKFHNDEGLECTEWRIAVFPDYPVAQIDAWQGGDIHCWAIIVSRVNGQKRPADHVVVRQSGRDIATLTPTISRPDVASRFDCNPNCGFVFPARDIRRLVDLAPLYLHVIPDGREMVGSPVDLSGAQDSPVDSDVRPRSPAVGTGPTQPARADRAPNQLGAEIRQQLIHLEYENSISRGTDKDLTIACGDHPRYGSDEINAIAASFDYEFYADRYPDVIGSGVDCVEHYFYTGWREKRDPAPWFSTDYYLTAYPDIGAADVNPFWHYLVAGHHEGRLPRSGSSAKRAVLESLKPLEIRTADYATPDHVRISSSRLKTLLKKATVKARGIVLAFSHDCYRSVTGGIQIFVADEQLKCNTRGFVYVHLSPLRAALHVKDDAPETTETRIIIDGEIVGVLSDAEIAESFQYLSDSLPEENIFVVHSPLGHSVAGLARIHLAAQSKRNFFWLHDYTSLCAGFLLLRNDIEYCGAPVSRSEGCRICIYSEARQTTEQRLRRLFDQCDFTLVSPSEVTRQIWLESSSLPHKGVLVVEHGHLSEMGDKLDIGNPKEVGTKARPVRVAYIGYPTLHKGWLTYERILDQMADYANYIFFHFGTAGSIRRRKNLRGVESTVKVDDRDLMTRHLLENGIDLVVIAAEWPETFSYVIFEALAAGCDIVTLSRSGNVAAVVRKLRRGLVFEQEDEIIQFFTSGKAVAYARARAQYGAYASEFVHGGTTATLI